MPALAERLRLEFSRRSPVHYDRLSGGLGDKASPADFDREQIAKGLKVEMEHTSDPRIALEIVLDHLTENRKYYDELGKLKLSRRLSAAFERQRYAKEFVESEHPRDEEGKFSSTNATKNVKPHNTLEFREDNLESVWKHWKSKMELDNPQLHPLRVGELAAARISNAIGKKVADIDDKIKASEPITTEEEDFYDNIYVNKWSPTRQLERLSGSRTIISDKDESDANKPLESKRDMVNRLRDEKIESVLQRAGDSPRLVVLEDKDSIGMATFTITQSAKSTGRWQLSWFGRDGKPHGDMNYDSFKDAVHSALGRHVGESPPIGSSDLEVSVVR